MASLDDVMRTIEQLYDAAVEPERWPAALQSLADLLKASAAVAAFRDDAGKFPLCYSIGIAPEAAAAYFERHHSEARVMSAVRNAPIGAFTDQMMVPRDVLLRSDYIQTWGIPNGVVKCIQAFAFQAPECSGFIGGARPLHGDDFEAEQVKLLTFLLPHVERAMKMQLRLQQARLTEISAAQALEQLPYAVLLVDRKARVFFANAVAQALLIAGDGIGVNPDGLHAASPACTLRLRRMIAAAADTIEAGLAKSRTGAALRLERCPPRVPLSAVIAPLRARDGLP